MAALTVDQIRGLFAEEATDRLRNLGQLLLELEETGGDDALVGSIFREVHTLKGSAAVAGLDQISRMAHELEELVDDLRSGRRATTPEVIDILLAGSDRLTALVAGDEPPPAIAREIADADPAGAYPAAERRTAVAEQPRTPPQPGANPVPQRRAATLGHPGPLPPVGEASGVARRALDPAQPSSAPPPPGTPRRTSAPPPSSGGAQGVVMVPTERLEELVRLVGEAASAHLRVGLMLRAELGRDPALIPQFNELSRSLTVLQDRATRTQMVPVSTVTDQLRRAVRDLARAQGKDIRWDERGADTELDRGVLRQLSDSLLHLVRNAVDHGIESPAERVAAGKPPQATLRLHAMQLGSEVIIAVTDDGRGIDVRRVAERAAAQGIETEGMTDADILQLTFAAGLSTTAFVTDVSGRGVGLDVVRSNVEAARGRVEVRSDPGSGAEFRVIVPITLAVLRCLLIEAGGQRFALPFHRVVLSQAYDAANQSQAEGRPVVWVGKQPVAISPLTRALGMAVDVLPGGPVVVLTDTTRRHAFHVDRLVGQRDVVLKGLSPLVLGAPAVAGASVEPDGTILLVLDPPGLIARAQQAQRSADQPTLSIAAHARQRVLVVDDALTVRELQRGILERAGYDVRVAVDGVQAMLQLADESCDLVLTDVEMPLMDGFALTAAIRAHPTLANVPVLILTSRSSAADRQRGLDAGADGYISKSGFDETSLLSAVNRLLGVRP